MVLTEEEKTLLEKHGEYIAKRIMMFNFVPPLQYEEAISYVYEKLCEKIKTYKSLDIFEKYLNRNIKLFVYNYYKIARHEPMPINENINIKPTTIEDDYWISDRDMAIACAINDIDSESRNILLLYFYDNKTELFISRMLGVSRSTISRKLHKALDKIKKPIEKRLREINKIREDLL